MKKLLLSTIMFLTLSSSVFAQRSEMSSVEEKTLIERVTKLEKKNDAFNLSLFMKGSLNGYVDKLHEEDNDGTAAGFKLDDIRIGIDGKISNKVYYKYLQSLNRGMDGSGNIDNLNAQINVAGIGVNVSDKFGIFMGRQFVAYGGYEFDAAPMNVYEFSNIINNITCYLTGIDFSYYLAKNHQLRLQVLNNSSKTFDNTYGTLPLAIEKSEIPMQATLNWNGSMFNGHYNTRWSATYSSVAKGKSNFFYAFGNQLVFGKFNMYADVYYSSEDIDTKGLLSSFKSGNNTALNAEYLGVATRFNYQITPKLKVLAKFMYDTTSASDNESITPEEGVAYLFEEGKYSTSYGYVGGFEYAPFDTDLRFFVNYVGRHYENTRPEWNGRIETNNTNRFSIGFICKLSVF